MEVFLFDIIVSNIRFINVIQVVSEIFFVLLGVFGFNSGIIRCYIVVFVIGKEYYFFVIVEIVIC